jgi:hypothetical protein
MRNVDKRQVGTVGRRVIIGLRAGAGILVALGSWSLYAAASATQASAATLNGTATIVNPVDNSALSGGGSATVFGVTLPAQAACSGDTATDGYHVYSYLVPQGTAVLALTFVGGTPSSGFGLIDGSGYYGADNTAPTTGQIINIPADFEWADLLNAGATAAGLTTGNGKWETGLLCANSTGVVTDFWNNEVTFAASKSDSNGFTWTDVPGPDSSGTPSTTTTSSTTSTSTTTTLGSTTSSTTGSTSGTTSTVAGATAGSSGSSGSSDSSGSDGSDGTSASSGSLAFTGALITRGVAIGMLCLGFGLIMLGLSVKVRREIAPRIVLK